MALKTKTNLRNIFTTDQIKLNLKMAKYLTLFVLMGWEFAGGLREPSPLLRGNWGGESLSSEDLPFGNEFNS